MLHGFFLHAITVIPELLESLALQGPSTASNREEATPVWCHKLRLAYFFSAMRHFSDGVDDRGRMVHYHELTHRGSDDRGNDFAEILRKDVGSCGRRR